MEEKNEQIAQIPNQPVDLSLKDIVIGNESLQAKVQMESPGVEATSLLKMVNPLLEISDKLTDLSVGIAFLKKNAEDLRQYDKTKEEAFDRLYKELDVLKKNENYTRNRPLYIDIILLFDRIQNIVIAGAPANNLSADFRTILGTIADELVEMLDRQGIEMIIATSDFFDPIVQRAVATEPVSDSEKNGRIARVVRKGFSYFNQILRAEEVVVYKYSGKNIE